MTDREHTKEPWAVEKGEDNTHVISNNEDAPVAFWLSKENADRIVAMSRFLAGFTNQQLKGLVSLEKQAEDYLSVFKKAEKAIEGQDLLIEEIENLRHDLERTMDLNVSLLNEKWHPFNPKDKSTWPKRGNYLIRRKWRDPKKVTYEVQPWGTPPENEVGFWEDARVSHYQPITPLGEGE